MSITREQFLNHVHPPLESLARPSSPTKSTYRVRWRELSEWNDFVSDAQTYWDYLGNVEKSHILTGVSVDYWAYVSRTLTALAPTVSLESHLSTPFSLLYSAPHNETLLGAGDSHARITTQLPTNTVGQPDGCFEFNNTLAGIVELKSFWNITERTILEVLQGPIVIFD